MGCNQMIYEDMMAEHTDDYTQCNLQIGVAAEEGVPMGGSQVQWMNPYRVLDAFPI